MADLDACPDVLEVCALLQCLGYSVRALDSTDNSLGHESSDTPATKTVTISCQESGLHVVLESCARACSCPAAATRRDGGVWQVSAIAGGKQLDKEFGCSLIGSLPRAQRERLSVELSAMVRAIRAGGDRASSMSDLKTPEKILNSIEAETPTRYRSLDTLTGKSSQSEHLPAPGSLARARLASEGADMDDPSKKMVGRQSTYTLSSTPGSARLKNKTSSPIQSSQSAVLERLVAAQAASARVQANLEAAMRHLAEQDRSMSSLALDVSNISVRKATENSRAQFASSPNLSGAPEEPPRLRRGDSSSTPALHKPARLNKLSLANFRGDNDKDKAKKQDGKSKLHSLFKAKISTPIRGGGGGAASGADSPITPRNKYSHIKSTIPRPAKKE